MALRVSATAVSGPMFTASTEKIQRSIRQSQLAGIIGSHAKSGEKNSHLLSTAAMSVEKNRDITHSDYVVQADVDSRPPGPSKFEPPAPEGLNVACACFALVGVGYLFPFSALTLPIDYWNHLFPDFNIDFAITSIFIYCNLSMLALLVAVSTQTETATANRPVQQRDQGKLSASTLMMSKRIIGGFVGQFIVMVFVPSSYFFGFTESHDKTAILTATAFAAISTAFLDSSMMSLASQFPVRVQEYFQLGVGLSSLIGSIYRDFTKLVMPPSAIVGSSLFYFYVGAFTVLACILAFMYALKLPISRQCLSEKSAPNSPTGKVIIDEDGDAAISLQDLNSPSSDQLQESNKSGEKWKVFKMVWFNGLCVSLVFSVSLSLFPPLITEIPVREFSAVFPPETRWWPLILLTLQSIADCIGRVCVRWNIGVTKTNVYIPVILRMLMIPIIVMCVKGVVFASDGWSIFWVLILGFSNGYLGTMSIIYVVDGVEGQYQATAGMFISFFINFGLVLGASLGLVFQKILL
jgi:equilibrative nucleoside transporter 1/2/3